MSKFLIIPLLLALVNHGTELARAWDDQDFFTYCPPSKCSKHGPEIRFPFQLESSNTSSLCGISCHKFACSGQDTILDHQYLGRCNVTAIDYRHKLLTIIPLVNSLSPCPLQTLISKSIPFDNSLRSDYLEYATLVCCSKEILPDNDAANYFVGPVSCLSNATHFSYMVDALMSMSVLPLDCKVVSDGVIPIPLHNTITRPSRFKGSTERILGFAEMTISSECPNKCSSYFPYTCEESCEFDGGRCAFSSERNQSFCMPSRHGSHVKVIAATLSVATLVVLLLVVTIVLYLSLKTRYSEEIHLKVEMFLKVYGTSKPTRYTFAEVKKISRRFKEKIGQGGFGSFSQKKKKGGFGSVYKGELPNGVPVAVKMLENFTGEGEVFINEVATMGLIHHANIVRLLGYCSEGTRRVLIYEFMPNESLEKYIFSHDSSIFLGLLVPDKMQDIALGIARGMEYLHQGCNQRILHFDIKPHNILLDYSFNPKISDFGLAKQCARDQSMITLTAARGTMGYIAPEFYCRNFGGVSYKSDVYSFGMLVLEMVSGRRNSDPSTESQNDVYLPEWIYDKVILGEESVLTSEMTNEEREKVKRLAIVALWCIQCWIQQDQLALV